MNFNFKKDSGFTIIELMVVITIIGLLSSIILGSLQQARLKAQDSKRISEIQQMEIALDLYYSDHGQYPLSDNQGCGNWDTSGSGVSGPDFIAPLASNGYINNLKDPTTNDNCGNYRYYRYPAGWDPVTPGFIPCDATKGAFYVLEIIALPASSPHNPGFKCGVGPSYFDWTNQGAYVVGKFENG